MSNRKERAKLKALLVKVEKYIDKKKYPCLYNGCTAPAIKSHSQQKNGPLRSIAEAGKVYRLDDNLQKSYNFGDGRFQIEFSQKGIGDSSLFRGFCNEHEKLFSIFEDQEITPGNHKQFCVLFYRTLCYEKARKRRESDRLERFIEDGVHDLVTRRILKSKLDADRAELVTSCDYLIDKAFNMISSDDYSLLSSRYIRVQGNLNVSCSSVLNLHLDDYIAYRKDNPNSPLPGFTFNILPGNEYSYIVLSWLAEFDCHAQWLLEGVSEKESLEVLLNRFAFCDSEDACVNPSLWRSLSSVDEIIKNMHHVSQRGKLEDTMIPKIIKLP
ncbi:hypothetical protein D3C79_664240 [compost metagenome]